MCKHTKLIPESLATFGDGARMLVPDYKWNTRATLSAKPNRKRSHFVFPDSATMKSTLRGTLFSREIAAFHRTATYTHLVRQDIAGIVGNAESKLHRPRDNSELGVGRLVGDLVMVNLCLSESRDRDIRAIRQHELACRERHERKALRDGSANCAI